MKVLTFSRLYPRYHPKAGDQTYFVEKITSLLSVISPGWTDDAPQLPLLYGESLFDFGINRQCQETELFKSHTIRSGDRWKAGEWASLRIWSGKPYASKQFEFAKVQIIRTWKLEVKIIGAGAVWYINGYPFTGYGFEDKEWENLGLIERIAKNDGLTVEDFLAWFRHPLAFSGQIICWNESIEY